MKESKNENAENQPLLKKIERVFCINQTIVCCDCFECLTFILVVLERVSINVVLVDLEVMSNHHFHTPPILGS